MTGAITRLVLAALLMAITTPTKAQLTPREQACLERITEEFDQDIGRTNVTYNDVKAKARETPSALQRYRKMVIAVTASSRCSGLERQK